MRSALYLAAVFLSLALAMSARGQESVSTERPVLLSADRISYDEELGIVIASGNVEIAQEARVLMADTVTYNAAIAACERGGQWARVLELLSEMPDRGVPPDVVTYSVAISACENCGQWQPAQKLKMHESSAYRDSHVAGNE